MKRFVLIEEGEAYCVYCLLLNVAAAKNNTWFLVVLLDEFVVIEMNSF